MPRICGFNGCKTETESSRSIGDCVRCHYCGLGLKHWDPDDKPLDEHVRWRSSCGYLQSFLGGDIIARTMARLAQSRRGEVPPRSETSESVVAGLVRESIGVGGQTEVSTGADNSTTSREAEAEALITGEAAQLAREMGFPDNLIHRSIKALLQTRAGRRAVTPNNVVHAILYLRERGEESRENPEPAAELVDTEDNGDNDGEDDDDDDEEHRTSSPENGGVNSSGDNTSGMAHTNHTAILVESASAQHGSPKRQPMSTGSSSSETLSSTRSSNSGRSILSSGDSGYGSGSSFEGSSLSSGGSSGSTSSHKSSGRLPAIKEDVTTLDDLRRVEQENQELLERRRCKICLDNDVGVLFLPCGHLVCCEECAPSLRRCPMCRKRISSSVHTKFPPIPNAGQG